MKFKLVTGWKSEFEEELNILTCEGYWLFGNVETNIIQDNIYYSVLLQKI